MAADYGSTVGMDDEGFNRNLVSQLSNGLNVPSEAIEYPSVHPGMCPICMSFNVTQYTSMFSGHF